uniref:Uncharacterized protein n=1 Tax=Tanacetum cinerariifolium TaxID=118510 RepID=A0A699KFE2_TANCI|nr:hypothetical protein [Tanacetum cinerariifolium]
MEEALAALDITPEIKQVSKKEKQSKTYLQNVDKFIFSVDFVILDMVKDFRLPIILERSFLAKARTKKHRRKDVQRLESNLKTRFSQLGRRIRGHSNSYSCGKKVYVWAGYEFAQDTRVKSSSLAISTQSEEQCSGESLDLIQLLFINFHFLNCTKGTLYKPSGGMGVELPLDLYLSLIF